MKRKIFLLFLTLLILKISVSLSFAEDRPGNPMKTATKHFKGIGKEDTEPVDFYAESLEFRREVNLLIGEGSVDIEYRGISLQADRVEYNIETGDTKARGNVVVEDGTSILFCESIELNLKTKLGIIYNGELFLEPTYYLTGVEIRRLGLDRYEIINGYYTACQKTVPEWSIKVSEATAEVEGMLHAKGASFAIKKIPVLYLPYLLFPIKTKRATGLLFPRFGSSTRSGIRWYQPFFWAINDYSDATFSIDFQEKRGIGTEGNFNYVIDEESSGTINGYQIQTRSRSRQEGGTSRLKERWNIFAFHQQNLPEEGIRIVGKADVRSDENFLRDFKESFEERTQQSDVKSNSYLFLTKGWEKNAFLFSASEIQDRIRSEPINENIEGIQTKSTFTHLPELKFVSLEQPLFGGDGLFKGLESLSQLLPVKFHLETSLASMKSKTTRELIDNVEVGKKRRFNTERFDIHPSISLPLSYRNLFTLTPSIGIRETFYNHRLHGEDEKNAEFAGSGSTGKRVKFVGNSALTREMYDISLRFDAPRIYKIFDMDSSNIQKLKHVIEPNIEYKYIPALDQHTIIQTDPLDFIKGREFLTYSIINRLYAKFKSVDEKEISAREIAVLKISQFYDFKKDEESVRGKNLEEGMPEVQSGALSDFNVDLELYLLKNTTINFISFIDPHKGDLDRLIGNIMLEQEFLKSKLNASLSWRWTDPDKNQALDWTEPDFNPAFQVTKNKTLKKVLTSEPFFNPGLETQVPFRNTFTALNLGLTIPYGWEFGYLGRFYNTGQFMDRDIFNLRQREFALRTKYTSQCWSVEATYGKREFFREGRSKESFDDRTKDERFFWVSVQLESLGAVTSK